jgi:hypothetical protein
MYQGLQNFVTKCIKSEFGIHQHPENSYLQFTKKPQKIGNLVKSEKIESLLPNKITLYQYKIRENFSKFDIFFDFASKLSQSPPFFCQHLIPSALL